MHSHRVPQPGLLLSPIQGVTHTGPSSEPPAKAKHLDFIEHLCVVCNSAQDHGFLGMNSALTNQLSDLDNLLDQLRCA